MRRCLNTIKTVAAAILITAGTASPMLSQEYKSAPIEISKEKVRVDGKICYSHIVQERQTLHSISKAYGVSIEDIYMFNPTLKETGLRKNSIIIIPSKDAVKTAETVKTVSDTTATATASVQEPQTSEPEEQQSAEPQKKVKRIHIAKWYEDLDAIASQYGVTAEDIMKANNLNSRKLVKRQKLLIPYPGEYSPEPAQDPAVTAPAEEAEPESEIKDSTITPEGQLPVVAQPRKVEASIILPLTTPEGEPNRNNMDFYCGALLAVHDLAENGIDCNLNVYDLMDSRLHLSSETIKGSDVVIGPVSTADLTRLFFSINGANAIISPLDPRAEKMIKDHQEMIQAPTPHRIQYNDLVKWMEEDFREGDKVVMITEKGIRHSNVSAPIKEALDSSALAYSPFSYSILEGRDITEPLTALMSTTGANRIIVASESEAFVNDVIRNLNLLIYNNLEIVLYAPSKVRGFETIEVENFHNTSMHVSLGYHIDYESDAVKKFLLKYRALYNTEPTQFAFQGYDLARYFLGLSAKYGKDWKEHLADSPEDMLQSTFRFNRQPVGGYINNGVRRIVYDKGYEVRRVR